MSDTDESTAPELLAALSAHPAAEKIFVALPPLHRQRYCDHVAEAKRGETRERRAERMVQMILATDSGT